MWMWNFFYNSMDCIVQPDNGKGGVYVGSIQAANNITELNKKGIRAVLCVAANIRIKYEPKDVDSHKIILAEDLETFDLGKHFKEGIDFINKNREKTNVLIHCFAGVSRSGAMVVAYLMETHKKGFKEAWSMAKEKRSVITPNEGFKRQLEKFETELKMLT